MSEVTRLLDEIDRGAGRAAEELLPLVYDELRRLAARELSSEPGGQTLQPTALVHEAYLRLVGGESPTDWKHRGHFFGAAARAMRRILVDNARKKASLKRGGHLVRHDVDDLQLAAVDADDELLALDEALNRLAEKDPVKAELVQLRYFAGMTGEQAAGALEISVATADRYWAYARAWLRRELAARADRDSSAAASSGEITGNLEDG